jgi:GT2 family glycosyltransferase
VARAVYRSLIALFDHLRTIRRNWSSRLIAATRRQRWLQPLHRFYGPIKYQYLLPACQAIARTFRSGEAAGIDHCYQQWAEWCEKTRYNRERAAHNIEQLSYRPKISIIMPVFNTPEGILREAIDSVRSQYYADWQLCICDDASTAAHIRRVLSEYSAKDERIRVVFSPRNAGIAHASNCAMCLATGEFVGLLDHDDKLTPDALYEVVAALQTSDFDLIYSDEDRLDSKGRRSEPAFKPAWSPDLLLSCMYLAHFCVYRKSIVDAVGGIREGFDGSQDYDLALRVTEQTDRIAHIPKVLYHWRRVAKSASSASDARHSITKAGQLALTDSLRRRGIEAEVESERSLGFYRVRRKVPGSALVSIVIPTTGSFSSLRRCIRSIESRTDHKNYEIIVLDHAGREPAAVESLERLGHRVIGCDTAVNDSALINIGARESIGDYLLFLHDDTEVINSEWLTALLEHASRSEVGAVGAKLLYRDGRIQHAGIVLGITGIAGHAHRYVNGFTGAGYLNYPNVIRNYSAVTEACLMTRREVFESVAGFDEQSPQDHCDVDFCLRLQQRNYLIVYTPYAQLYHHKTTQCRPDHPDVVARFASTWESQWMDDTYYNPNLSRCREDFSIDFSKPEALCCIYSHFASDKHPVRLDEGTVLIQEFVSSEDYLCAIGIDFESINNNGEGVVRLYLRDYMQTGNDIAMVEVDALTIEGKRQFLFTFDPIRDSRSKRFSFYIEKTTGQLSGSAKGLSHSSDGWSVTVAPQESRRTTQNGISFRVYCLKQAR